MITCLNSYTLQLCIFDLSPVSPKGEKRFVLLTKTMMTIQKTALKQTGSSPLGEVRERSVMIGDSKV